MSTGGRRTARLLLGSALGAGLLALSAAPAHASMTQPESGTMSGGQALVVFGLVPLTIVAIIWLAVAAPGWTRAGRADAVDVWTGEPLVLESTRRASDVTEATQLEAATGLPAPGEAEPDDAVGAVDGVVVAPPAEDETTGGTSARW